MLRYSSKLWQLDSEMLSVGPREGARQPTLTAQVTHSLLMTQG